MNHTIPYIEATKPEIIRFWISKLAGFSILCSFYLILKISLHCERRKKSYNHIVLALSINSILSSGAIFCHSWPIPRSYSINGAAGTQGTCNAQGAIFTLSYVTICSYYTLFIMLALSSVWDKFDETWFLKFEIIVHASIYILPTIMVAVALKTENFNPGIFNQCTLAAYPLKCDLGGQYGKCIRGGIVRSIFLPRVFTLAFMTTFAVGLTLFTLLVISIQMEEERTAKLIEEKVLNGLEEFPKNVRKKKSRIKVSQASIFWVLYVVTAGVPFFMVTVRCFGDEKNIPDSIYSFHFLCMSLNGCLNLLVYSLLLKKKQDPNDICMPPSSKNALSVTAHMTTRDRELNSSMGNILNSEGGEEHIQTCFVGPEFSIFDGTNPSSSRWGQFIDTYTDDDYDKSDVEAQDEKEKSFPMDISDDFEQ